MHGSVSVAAGKVEATTAVYQNRMQLAKPLTYAEKEGQSEQDPKENPGSKSADPSSVPDGDHGDPAPQHSPPEVPAKEGDEQSNQSQEQPAPSLEAEPVSPEQ